MSVLSPKEPHHEPHRPPNTESRTTRRTGKTMALTFSTLLSSQGSDSPPEASQPPQSNSHTLRPTQQPVKPSRPATQQRDHPPYPHPPTPTNPAHPGEPAALPPAGPGEPLPRVPLPRVAPAGGQRGPSPTLRCRASPGSSRVVAPAGPAGLDDRATPRLCRRRQQEATRRVRCPSSPSVHRTTTSPECAQLRPGLRCCPRRPPTALRPVGTCGGSARTALAAFEASLQLGSGQARRTRHDHHGPGHRLPSSAARQA